MLLLGQLATPFIAHEGIVWSGWGEAGKCLPFTANQIKSPYALWADSYIEKAPDYIVNNITILRFLTTIHATVNGLLVLALLWSIQIHFKIF